MQVFDLVIKNGRIAAIGTDLARYGTKTIEAGGNGWD
ncbi:hypothetical protein P378_09910 [Desulforamulus profundi]|uniref:Amidohydrolase 3 domain-containing protein n=1 Tax=Desulforamulus profundi TaxID=1383067 RepID=A0A2C6MFN8_9FIRM|nr:hypothetical protein P378_09910 [Desulforamulus profundi]